MQSKKSYVMNVISQVSNSNEATSYTSQKLSNICAITHLGLEKASTIVS